MLAAWLRLVRKTKGLPISVITEASEPTICGTPACWVSCMLTLVEEE